MQLSLRHFRTRASLPDAICDFAQDTLPKLHPVIRALLSKQPTIPPIPIYPNGNKLVVRLGEQLTIYSPAKDVEGVELVETYELDGATLPEGVRFDCHSGAIEGRVPVRPLSHSLEFSVRIYGVNRISKSEPGTLHVTITSDVRELLEPEHAAVVPRMLARFPTLAKLREWWDKLYESHRDRALDVVLQDEVGLKLPSQRFLILGVLQRALAARPSPSNRGWQLPRHEVSIGALIRTGGQASVYRGKWHGVDVAIKIFGFGPNHISLTKLRREIDREMAALTSLTFPNIVQLYGYFEEPDCTGFVMEYCAERDLADWCVEKGLHAKLVVVAETALALAFLHSRCPSPVIHGDVKASTWL